MADQFSRAIPSFSFSIWVPKRPEDIARRHFNRLAKEALRETIAFHHLVNLPKHFQHSARSIYGYKPRKQSWVMHKIRKWGTGGADLVASGASKRRILSLPAKITIGGAAEGGKKGLEGKLTVRFAFNEKLSAQQKEKYEARQLGHYARRAKRARVPPKAEVKFEDMKREIRATTREERTELARKFRDLLISKFGDFRQRRERLNTIIG
jgi:hypothetical protein